MKKTLSVILLTLALGAFAFSQGGGGGGQGRGQRGNRGGPAYDRPGAQYTFIGRSDVQTELKLTDDQKTKLTAANADRRQAMQGIGQDATQEERTAAMAKAGETYNTTIAGILTDDQKKRLMGIFVQMAKGMALSNPDVQSAIGMSSDQASKVKDLIAAERKANAGLPTDDPQARRDAMAKNAATLDSDLMAVLTDDEKTKLAALAGDKFTPDPSIRGNGGGGGGRRGGGGGGGGGGGN